MINTFSSLTTTLHFCTTILCNAIFVLFIYFYLQETNVLKKSILKGETINISIIKNKKQYKNEVFQLTSFIQMCVNISFEYRK